MKQKFSKIKQICYKMQDLMLSDIFYVLPSFVKWLYLLYIKKKIVPFSLKSPSGKKAILYLHSDKTRINNSKEKIPILILHGMHGHPAVMLDLVKSIPKDRYGPIFNFYIKYEIEDLDAHRVLIRQALDYIEKFVKKKYGDLKGIVVAGHSMGGIESANMAFVEKDKRLLSVISIAGRLHLLEGEDIGSKSLESSINAIYKEIQSMPDFPLFQIVGDKDWCIPLESIVDRKNMESIFIIKKASHLNLLFKKQAHFKFNEFLRSLI
jgi:hypothetical protein